VYVYIEVIFTKRAVFAGFVLGGEGCVEKINGEISGYPLKWDLNKRRLSVYFQKRVILGLNKRRYSG
jgi:hypothetical protein